MPDRAVDRIPERVPDRIVWGEDALRRELAAWLPGITVDVVRQARSTNSALIEQARGGARPGADRGTGAAAADAPHTDGGALVRRSVESAAFGRRSIDLQPCLLVAEHQTAGRGREGRHWQSAAGASLTFSLALPLAAEDLSGLSLAVGVAIADALDAAPAPTGTTRIALKWPNDLWLVDAAGAGRKLGGVLIETIAAGAQRLVVVGVGLNVHRFEASEVTTGFAALDEREPDVSAPAVLARIALPLVQALNRFEREGFASFADGFAARDLLSGQEVTTTSPAAPRGIASGVSSQGALLVRVADGALIPVTSGEVSVRLAEPAA